MMTKPQVKLMRLLGQKCDEGTKPEEFNLNQVSVPDVITLSQVWWLDRQLGSGGFAQVYEAHNDAGERAAVKLIPQLPGTQREILFEEMDGAKNVIPVLDRGEVDGYWVLVMPRAEKSLREYLDERGGHLAANEAVPVLVDITEALVAVEDRVVHRDIKPENILLFNGHWQLADFGIARYAGATTAPDTLKYAKTAPYAAPEQWREEQATSATDVYAVGVVAYELLSGRAPFLGPEYRHQHLEELPPKIDGIPSRVRSLIDECLYKPNQARPRPQNVLARLKGSLDPASPGGQLLQQANARAVEQQTEELRQQSAERAAAERRQELYGVANQALGGISDFLGEQVMDNAPAAQSYTSEEVRGWSLNDVSLRIGLIKKAKDPAEVNLPFEVIAYATVSVVKPADQHGCTGRSHSLWYCDAKEHGVFRWYETAFWNRHGNSREVPFALSPEGRDVQLALSPAMHICAVAWPFTPIDQGEEENFVEQCIQWFGQAANGQLRYPRQMPEKEASGSWRRRS